MRRLRSRGPAWLAFAALALAVAATPACRRPTGGAPGDPAPASAPSEKLRLGVSALRISLPVFVAAERGLFARHGLDVELRTYPTAQPMVDDVILGNVDAAGYAAYPIVFASAKGARHPPRLVTALLEDGDHRLSYVLGKQGGGLRFPRDAAGKRVGILPTVAYQRWLAAILRAAAAPVDGGAGEAAAVKVVPLAPAMQAQALAEGAVDLLFTGDPMATAALAAGKAEIVDDGPPCAARLGSPFPFGGFVLAGAFAEARPGVARAVVAALDDAIAEVRRDPAGARAAMARFIRPEEAAWVGRYPDARYLSSAEVPASWLPDEVARERRLGILDFDPVLAAPTGPATAPQGGTPRGP